MRIASAIVVFSSLIVLAGCSLLPSLSSDSSGNGSGDSPQFGARDLNNFFDLEDTPRALDLAFEFSTIDGPDRVSEITEYWHGAKASEEDCFDSYAASFLVGNESDDDEYVYIAFGDSNEGSSYVSVDGRVFADDERAAGFFDVVAEASQKCSDAGGYKLFGENGQIWASTDVSTEDAVDLDLPDDVHALYQKELVVREFAEGFRVIFLQRDNVVIAITVQLGKNSNFTFDDGDTAAETIAEALSKLD